MQVLMNSCNSCAISWQLFIANEWRAASSGSTFATVNPSTAEKIADISEAKEVRCNSIAFNKGESYSCYINTLFELD